MAVLFGGSRNHQINTGVKRLREVTKVMHVNARSSNTLVLLWRQRNAGLPSALPLHYDHNCCLTLKSAAKCLYGGTFWWFRHSIFRRNRVRRSAVLSKVGGNYRQYRDRQKTAVVGREKTAGMVPTSTFLDSHLSSKSTLENLDRSTCT